MDGALWPEMMIRWMQRQPRSKAQPLESLLGQPQDMVGKVVNSCESTPFGLADSPLPDGQDLSASNHNKKGAAIRTEA